MKNKMKTPLHNNKFPAALSKQYVKKLRIYPAFLYHRLDKWLKQMSADGWHIVDCGILFFWFEKGEPEEKEYFTYGLSTQEGKYSISLRYPFLEKTYGVKKKKSKINSNEGKKHQIVEIDLNRIDVNNDVGYRELIEDRNRLYLRYFIRNFSIILSVLIAVALFLLF